MVEAEKYNKREWITFSLNDELQITVTHREALTLLLPIK